MSRKLTSLVGSAMLMLMCVPALAQNEVQSYIERLADRTQKWHQELEPMQPSAERAARNVINGGNLYAGGSQGGFAIEALRRAGGLMLLKQFEADTKLNSADTLLLALLEPPDEELLALMDSARQAGAQVVLFDAGRHINDPSITTFPQNIPADIRPISTASISNVIGMWAWTGQLITACLAQGKMPCMYESYALPGGADRGAYLQGHDSGRLHAAVSIAPDDAKQIASQYLRQIEYSLRAIAKDEQEPLNRAAALLNEATRTNRKIVLHTIGHLYPGEMDQPQQPEWIQFANDEHVEASPGPALLLQYQEFPWKLVQELEQAGRPIVLTCSQPALATFTIDPHHVYINPHWPLTDGVVNLQGYDVAILPASGVMNTAIYWQLVEYATASK